MKPIRYYIPCLLALSALSCSFLDEEPQVICPDTFYQSETEVKYGLAGVYGVMASEAFYGNNYSLMLSNVDDLSYYNRATTNNPSCVFQHDASTTEIYTAWTEIYRGIGNANAFMEAVSETGLDRDGAYYAEARFLRAYYHFILAQAWGDVPLRTSASRKHEDTSCAASSQYDVLCWAASEMEECLENITDDISVQPSRVNRNTVHGILARLYLFLAGSSVEGPGGKREFYGKAMEHCSAVIETGQHRINPSYSQVFINMIKDGYDTEWRESMWEVEFNGDRSSPDRWTNGRIGDVIGLRSSGREGYESFLCNYSYAMYDGTLQLWNLYWTDDRTAEEDKLGSVTDARQEWNMPPYNYEGYTSGGVQLYLPSVDRTPYHYRGVSTFDNPVTARAIRNCGKWRRETEYEALQDNMSIYTGINFPILRYADILLMYAEASNEYEGAPSQAAYGHVKAVRDRAGIGTIPFSEYDYSTFRQLVRNERGRELCFESLRRYDLIRWGVFVESMGRYGEYVTDDEWVFNNKSIYAAAIGSAVKPRHILLPIPTIELGVNDKLVQNKLWR